MEFKNFYYYSGSRFQSSAFKVEKIWNANDSEKTFLCEQQFLTLNAELTNLNIYKLLKAALAVIQFFSRLLVKKFLTVNYLIRFYFLRLEYFDEFGLFWFLFLPAKNSCFLRCFSFSDSFFSICVIGFSVCG